MKTIPAISIESQEVIRRLEKADVGETISYEELSKICMGDPQTNKRHVLHTARNRLLMDRHMVFECVANVGLKRIDDKEIVDTAELVLRKINKASRRALHKLSCVNFDALDHQRQVRHNAVASMAGVISYATTPQKIRRLENAVDKAQARLSLQDTLNFFKGKTD